MIHDILLSCFSHNRKGLHIKQFMISDAVGQFLHPCEREILAEILKILDHVHDVMAFAQEYSGYNSENDRMVTEESSDDFSKGFYLKNFAEGVDNALDEYRNEIIKLEAHCTQNEKNSLVFILNALQIHFPMVVFLCKLIKEAQDQKLHGCILLQNLQQQSRHGDVQLERTMCKVIAPVKVVFLSHLANWLLFGGIDDIHSEFFIKFTPRSTDNISCNSSCTKSASNWDTGSRADDDIWQYEINMQQLPAFVSTIWAEKVLFIGQTVLVFKMDRRSVSHKRNSDIWKMPLMAHDSYSGDINELWNGNQSMFYKKIEELKQDGVIDIFRFENVIAEIKKYVSLRLSEITLNEVDLVHQLALIKDFYLLGRGEFYFEFLRQLYGNMEVENKTHKRDYPKTFEKAATALGITNDIEFFALSVENTNIDPDESCEFVILQNLHLKYIYKWPLNLLFSPKSIARYNKIFRFLLIVRKLQYYLHQVWVNHKWTAKSKGPLNPKIMNLRNHLMFFLDNMQYYIQVDVLESQFSILMEVIKTKGDFEAIQRAHTVFLANVLSQCFLLGDEDDPKGNISQSICHTRSPIYGTILDIFSICEKFSSLGHGNDTNDEVIKEVDRLAERFNLLIASLIKLFDLKTASSLGPLSQLLLRLDFNHWFSAN